MKQWKASGKSPCTATPAMCVALIFACAGVVCGQVELVDAHRRVYAKAVAISITTGCNVVREEERQPAAGNTFGHWDDSIDLEAACGTVCYAREHTDQTSSFTIDTFSIQSGVSSDTYIFHYEFTAGGSALSESAVEFVVQDPVALTLVGSLLWEGAGVPSTVYWAYASVTIVDEHGSSVYESIATLAGGPNVVALNDVVELEPGTYILTTEASCASINGSASGAGIVLDVMVDPLGCYPDCDGSGMLDLFDYLCFVNAFGAGDLYADCDGSGTLDLFDFLCFVNEFNAGCQ